MRLTKRYIIDKLPNIPLSDKYRYERYYISENVRIQRREELFQKEILENNEVIQKNEISEDEFNILKEKAIERIIRDSYLVLNNEKISIKKYHDKYNGLIRVEIKFVSRDEMQNFKSESWFGKEITNSPLAFDSKLIKLNEIEFLNEMRKYKN